MILWVLDIVINPSYSEAVQGTFFFCELRFYSFTETRDLFLIFGENIERVACQIRMRIKK